MKIELHIDRLVVDMASGAAHDRERLAREVSQALAQRIDARTAAQHVPASGQPLAQRIAAAVHQAIPAASRGGRS